MSFLKSVDGKYISLAHILSFTTLRAEHHFAGRVTVEFTMTHGDEIVCDIDIADIKALTANDSIRAAWVAYDEAGA